MKEDGSLNKRRNDIRTIIAHMRDNWLDLAAEVASVKDEHKTDKAAFVQEVLEFLSEDVHQCSMFQRRLPETADEQIIYDVMMCRRDVAAETEKAILNAMKQAEVDGNNPVDKGFDACFDAAEQIMPVVFARLMLSNNRPLDETANYLMAGYAAAYLKPGKRVAEFLIGVSFKDSVTKRLFEELPGAARLAYADLQVEPEKRAEQLLKCVRNNIGYPSKLRKEIATPLDQDGEPVEFEDPTSLDPVNLVLEQEAINDILRKANIKERTNEWCVIQVILENPYLKGEAGGNIEIGAQCGIKPNQVGVIRNRLRKKLKAAEQAFSQAVWLA